MNNLLATSLLERPFAASNRTSRSLTDKGSGMKSSSAIVEATSGSKYKPPFATVLIALVNSFGLTVLSTNPFAPALSEAITYC